MTSSPIVALLASLNPATLFRSLLAMRCLTAVVLLVASGLILVPANRAAGDVLWDFWDGSGANQNGWTVLNGGANFRGGDGGGVTPANSGGNFAGDGGHATFLFESPTFWFNGGTLDGTNIFSWGTGGGAGDQNNDGPNKFADAAAVLAYNGGNSNGSGQKGLAFLNTTTNLYDTVLFNSGNGGVDTYNLTSSQLTSAGLNLLDSYRLHYYENDDGGWGWGQLNFTNIAGQLTPLITGNATSSATGDWHNPATWTGSPTPPDLLTAAVVNGGFAVTAQSGQTNEAGTLEIQNAAGSKVLVNSGALLTVDQGVTVAAPGILEIKGTLNTANVTSDAATLLGAGGKLITGGGALQAVTNSDAVGVVAIENSAALTATDLNLFAGSTFLKQGDGKLSFTTGNNSLNNTNVVQVDGGELFMQAASNPLGGATLNLNGGTFSVEGAATSSPGIRETIFDGTVGDAQGNINAFITASGNLGVSDAQGVLTTHLHYQDDNAVSTRAAALGAVGFDNNNFAMLWQTHFTPTATGVWGFRHTGDVDDNDSFWIDTDGNGTFEIGNRFFSRGCCGPSGDQFTPSLTAGATYEFGLVMNDTGGGGWLRDMEFLSPAGGGWQNLDPSAFPALFTISSIGPIDMTDSPVSVTANSTLNAVTNTTAAFGGLSFDADNATLTTSGAPGGMTFTGTTFSPGVSTAGIQTDTNTRLGLIDDSGAGGPLTVTKSGTADLTLDQAPTSLGASTTLDVREGRMNVDYTSVNPTGSADFKLSGGTLATTANGLNLQTTLTVDNGVTNGLYHFGFHKQPEADMNLNGNGGLMAGGDPTSFPEFFGEALLINGPGGRGLDFDNDGDFINSGAIGQGDNYMNLVTGTLTVGAGQGGNWQFRTDQIDDRAGIWIDLDQDGVFESTVAGLGSNRGEQLAWQDGGWKTVNLSEGEYQIAFTHGEYTGGSSIRGQFIMPGGTATTIKPGDPAQSGLWGVTATSTLELNDTTGSNLQNLVLKNGNLRITGGSLLTVEQASFATDASSNVGLITNTPTILTDVAGLDGNNQAVNFTKTGAAELVLNQGGTGLGNATLAVAQGNLIGVHSGANPFGTGSLAVKGGQLILAGDGSAQLYDNALTVSGNGTLTAGTGGGHGAAGSSITLGSGGNGVALNSGTLTAQTTDGYSLTLAGPVSGAGNLIVASEITAQESISVGNLNVNAQLNATKSITASGTLDLNAPLNRTGTGSDANVTAGNLFLRTGTLEMAAGETLAVSGSALVESGATLRIDGNMTGAGGLTIAGGGTLGGSGNLANAVTIQDGGWLSAGNSPGILNTGSLTINSGGIFNWELGNNSGSPIWDQVNVNGNLDLNSGWTFRFNDLSAPLTTGDQLLFTYSGASNVDAVNFDTSLVDALPQWHTDAIEIFDDGSGSVFLRNLVVTGPASGNLTWDGATADWSFVDGGTDSHWDGGSLDQIPDPLVTATVNSGKATVGTADGATHTLTLGGGEVEIAPGRRLDVTDSVHVNGGLLDVQGTLDTNVNVDVNPGGTLDVAGGGHVEALQLNSSGTTTFDAGSTAALTKLNVSGGVTTLNLPNTPEVNLSGGNLNVNSDLAVERFNVSGGTADTGAVSHVVVSEKMTLADTDYAISSGDTFKAGGTINNAAADRLRLTGGTLTIGEEDIFVAGQLSQSVFFGTPNSETPMNLDGASYEHSFTRVFTGDKFNTILTMSDSHSGLATSEIQNWNTFPTFDGNADSFVTAFSGVFTPSSTGTYNFQYDGDDRNLMYIDLNGDGLFDNSDRVTGYTGNANGNVSLVAGESYNVLHMNQEYGGGQSLNWRITPPGQGQDRVNPADPTGNGGIWSTLVLGDPLSLTSTQIIVEQDSALNATGASAAFGNLTLEGGTLTTQGAPGGITFTDTTIAAAAVGIQTQTHTSSGAIDGGGLGATITKSGAADLVVQGAGSNLAGATFNVQGGRLIGVHGSNPFGAADLNLNGGEVVLSSGGGSVAYDNAVQVNADSKLTAGSAGGLGASGPLDVTLGNAGTGIALNSGTLTVETTDNYRLVVPGSVSGAGNIDVIGGSVKTEQGISAGAVSVKNTMLETAADLTATTGDLKLNGGTLKTSGAVNVSATTGDVRVSGNTNLNITSGHLTIAATGGAVPTGLQLHLDAGSLGLANGAPVTNWTDVSGHGRDANNVWNSPTYNTNGPNGQPVVQFTNDFLSTSFNFDPFTEYTILGLSRYTGGANGRVIASDTRNWLFGHHGNGDAKWHAEGWIHNGGGTSTDWHLYAGTITGAGDPLANFWKDGVQLATNANGSGNGTHMIGRLGLGGWHPNNETSNSEIAEVLIFDRVLTADELNNIGGYLNSKYALGFANYTGSLGTSFGELNMVSGSSLTLVGDGGPGTGEATFASIIAGHNATIHGSVIAKGDVTVGNSVGTLNVNGNYTQAGGSTYHWETGAGSSDLIAATGTIDASADWNLAITPLSHNAQVSDGTVLMSGGSAAAVPGAVTVTMADNVYSDLFNVSSATAVNSGNDVVLSGVVTASHTVSHGGTWSSDAAWTEGTGLTPTSGDVAIVAGGTVAANSGGVADNLALTGGNLNLTSGTLAVNNNVRIGGGSELTVDGGATQLTFGNETKVYDGGTLHLKNGGSTNLDKSIEVLAGGTLKTTGTQALQENVQFNSAAKLHVAAGTLSMDAVGLPSGAAAYYAFDDGGNLGLDSSGTGNNLTANAGTPTFFANGNIGGALDLRGTNASLAMPGLAFPTDVPTGGSAYTTSTWINPSGGGGWLGWGNFGAGSQVNAVRMNGSNSVLNYWWGNDLNANAGFNLETGDPPSGWHHVVATYDPTLGSNQHKIYIDGVLAAQRSASGLNAAANNFRVGVTNNGEWFNGLLDELLIYPRALSTEEIAKLFSGTGEVELGHLQVDNGATFQNTGSGAISVESLSGNGSVNSNTLIRSTLSPGNSIGMLTITGDLELASGAVYEWEMLSALAGEYDSVNVDGGNLLLDDWTLQLLDDPAASAAVGDKFYLYTGYSALGGAGLGAWTIDAGLVDPLRWDVSGAVIDMDAGGVFLTGLQVSSLTVIPEPSSFVLGLIALSTLTYCGLVARRRRRR